MHACNCRKASNISLNIYTYIQLDYPSVLYRFHMRLYESTIKLYTFQTKESVFRTKANTFRLFLDIFRMVE